MRIAIPPPLLSRSPALTLAAHTLGRSNAATVLTTSCSFLLFFELILERDACGVNSYEDSATREGIIYVMAQLHSPNTVVVVALSHVGGWPLTVPAPAIVRHASNATQKPQFEMLAGRNGTQVVVAGSASEPELQVTFPALDSQALFSYRY